MSDEIAVRLLPRAGASGQDVETRALVSLPNREAAEKIAAGQAEPVIEIRAHDPTLPATGVPLVDAFRLLVAQHPDALAVGGFHADFSTFLVRTFSEPPDWPTMAKRSRLREFAGLDRPPPPETDPWLGERAKDWWGPRPRIIRIDELDQELKGLIQVFTLTSVLHRFLKQLQDGALLATGNWEGDLATLENRPIRPNWWTKDILVQLGKDEIRELTIEHPRVGVRRWSGVHARSGSSLKHPETERTTQAGKAHLRAELRSWLEAVSLERRDRWLKKDYFKAAQVRFEDKLSRNLFNEIWKHAVLPEECKAPGRRARENPREI